MEKASLPCQTTFFDDLPMKSTASLWPMIARHPRDTSNSATTSLLSSSLVRISTDKSTVGKSPLSFISCPLPSLEGCSVELARFTAPYSVFVGPVPSTRTSKRCVVQTKYHP